MRSPIKSKLTEKVPKIRHARWSSRLGRRYLIFFLLVGPALLLRLFTAVYPVVQTVYLSFFEVDLLSQINRFVGLQNFRHLVSERAIGNILFFTLIFIAASTVLELILGMGVATLLNARFRGRKIARTVNLIPWAIPTIVAALGFRWMLDSEYGLVTDWIYRIFGWRPELLISPTLAQLSVILVNVWKNTPFMAVVLLAGLQSIPVEFYEAAKIDGATSFQRFRYITIPLSTPLVITLGLFFVIWQLASFDLIYGMTQGGPGVATTLIAYRIFQRGMLWFDWGTASALSVLLILIVAAVGVLGLYLFRRYEVTI